MKKATAWNGFYSTVKEIENLYTMDFVERVKAGKGKKYMKGLQLKAARYGKSLVVEHKWEDEWTHKYVSCMR